MKRMNVWILISIFLHILIIIFFSLKISFGQKKYIELSYLTVTHLSEKVEHKENPEVVTIKKEGEITPKEEKVIENTNVIEEIPHVTFDEKRFIPFYMVDELPTPLVKISPPYPEEAKRLGIEGPVVLKIYINEEGSVEEVEVIKSPSELLSVVTKNTVMGVKFKPARACGKNVPVCIELTIRFKLSG